MSTPPKISTLPNGLTIVSETMKNVETVSFGAYVNTGARNESAEINGAAHFLEHMAFKGTKKRTALEISETIENVGGYINAYTARETTAYYVKLLKEDLALGADLIGDVLTHSLFAEMEIEKERKVILQEIHQSHDAPDDIVHDIFQQTAFPNQPIGRPILGTTSSVQNMSRENLIHYMGSHYSAKNITIAAAGNLDHDHLVSTVQKSFADLHSNAAPKSLAAKYIGGRDHIERDLDQMHLVLGFEAPNYHDDDFDAAATLSVILGGGMSSRLFQEVREKRGLVYTIYSFLHAFSDSGIFGIYAGTSADETKELLPVIQEELHKTLKKITEEELKRAKSQHKASLLMSMESTNNRCSRLARQMQLWGRIIPLEERIQKIENLTCGDILQSAQKIFSTPKTISSIGKMKHEQSFEDFKKENFL
ncbi:insulinase family protein [Acetobacteraceae bacterium]|nr:insulinase family protein [Acetobacteraceae bacterium]